MRRFSSRVSLIICARNLLETVSRQPLPLQPHPCQTLTIFASGAILGATKLPRSATMPMNISLTPHLEEMIREKIASGSYNSASEVVREALRLLEQEDQLRSLKIQNLHQHIHQALHT